MINRAKSYNSWALFSKENLNNTFTYTYFLLKYEIVLTLSESVR